ncbi:MAG: DNA primase [Desulfobacterota bacterium]|nr:DNA primase [Thermodesulfobacteriota bacterium]
MDKTRSLIPESFVAQLKETSNIVSVISRYVTLKKAGRNFQGLCPFHQEKTPSFTVNEEKQFFHCFGCGQGGNVFGFLMRLHNLSFPEAVEELAAQQGLAVPRSAAAREDPAQTRQREALLEVQRLAADFYRRCLREGSEGRRGRDYLESRGLDEPTGEAFGLGLAPAGWDRLTKTLFQKKVQPELLEQAGLAVKNEKGGYYDRFRNRLMFPIFNERKQVVAFGGRALGEDPPKYLNSPETALFSKGRLLYGLAQALPAIRRQRQVLIVEGYFDLLTLFRQGFQQTVATLGTALTPYQVRRLKGLAEELVLIYDGDPAGRQAALRSVAVFHQEGVTARIKILPPEDDPDTFMNRVGPQRFAEELRQAQPMWTFYFEHHLAEVPGDIQNRIRLLERLLPALKGLSSEVERAYYNRLISERLAIDETVIRKELVRKSGSAGAPEQLRGEIRRSQVQGLEWPVLEALLGIPGALACLEPYDLPEIMHHPQAVRIFEVLRQVAAERGEPDVALILERLEEEDLKSRVTAMALKEFPAGADRELFLKDLIRALQLRGLRRQEQNLQQAIREQAGPGLSAELKDLLQQKQVLLEQRKALRVSSKN